MSIAQCLSDGGICFFASLWISSLAKTDAFPPYHIMQ